MFCGRGEGLAWHDTYYYDTYISTGVIDLPELSEITTRSYFVEMYIGLSTRCDVLDHKECINLEKERAGAEVGKGLLIYSWPPLQS